MRVIILSLITSFLLHNVSFGQVKTITNSDVITIENYKAEQSPGQPIAFKEVPEVWKYRMSIQENGDRQYLGREGKVFFVRDKFFTVITNGTKPVDENRRFKMFPTNQKLEPGLQWNVSYSMSPSGDCGSLNVSYRGTSTSGPEINVSIDGKETKLRTILVDLDGRSSYPNWGCGEWKLNHNILYSPDLDEIVSHRFMDLQGAFLYAGWRRVLKSIQTSGKAVGAEKPTESKSTLPNSSQ